MGNFRASSRDLESVTVRGNSEFGRRPTDIHMFTGSLYVSGRVQSNEMISVTTSDLHINGSTKSGDSSDDLHEFTGSLSVTGKTQFNNCAYTWPYAASGVGYGLTNDGDDNLSWTYISGEYSNGGDWVTSNRTLGNTTNYSLDIVTNSISRIHVSKNGKIGIGVQGDDVTESLTLAKGQSIKASKFKAYSSARFKRDIKPVEGALDKVKNLQGVSFSWKETGEPDIGLIAEDVAVPFPEIVDKEDDGKISSVNYHSLIGVLVECVKEQQVMIEEQKKVAVSQQRQIEELNINIKHIKRTTKKARSFPLKK